jgi:hypothetical protein
MRSLDRMSTPTPWRKDYRCFMRCCSVLSTVLMKYISRHACVKADVLPWRDLNLVVISFKDETDKHNAMMTEIWQSVLKRTPCEKEMSKYKAMYRECVRSECLRAESTQTHWSSACSQDQGRGVVPDMPIYGYTMWSLPFATIRISSTGLWRIIQSVCGET